MIACLDLEGVLVPEIWINVAERTGIDALRRTTRDEPDYDRLMRGRLEILARHGLGLPDPLPPPARDRRLGPHRRLPHPARRAEAPDGGGAAPARLRGGGGGRLL